ncbi:hypothetical protein [Paenibacillus sp. PL2-23]|uniref:hypothetical protein n=1 Tax=Paenibacillus sp. PL2-23 TaxID=2100729 RepID=UPI0030F97050
MIYSKIESIENYLDSIKRKKPDHIHFVRSNLTYIIQCAIRNGEDVEQELRDIRIHYQGQLPLYNAIANYTAILAILISLIIALFSVIPSSDENPSLFIFAISLIILILIFILLKTIGRANKKLSSFTIIIQVIDELLETQTYK